MVVFYNDHAMKNETKNRDREKGVKYFGGKKDELYGQKYDG